MRTVWMMFAGVAAAAAACQDANAPEAVAAVQVTAPATSVIVGGTLQLAATARASDGKALSGRPIVWTSSDTTLAAVSQGGLVVGHALGTVIIRATSEGRTGEVTLAVAQKPVASIELVPAGDVTLEVETTRTLEVLLHAADGEELTGRAVAWSSSDTAVAVVEGAGVLRARRAGDAIVTATVEGKTATLNVTAFTLVARVETDPDTAAVGVGEVAQITARAYDADGVQLNRTITWTSSDTAVAVVNAAGRVTATSTGSAVITATSQGKSATTVVRVGTWLESPLLRIGDDTLPATLYSVTRVIDGVERVVSFQATQGAYRLLSGTGRYELRFDGWLQVEGSPAVQATLVSGGVEMYDVFTNGYPILFPDGSDPAHDEPQYRGAALEDGNLGFTGRPEPDAGVVTLVFPGREAATP